MLYRFNPFTKKMDKVDGADINVDLVGFPLTYAHGGTNTTALFTQNSVIFAGATGFTQDNPNFNFNPTTKVLTIPTITGISTGLAINAGGSNQNITFTPSGTGKNVFNSSPGTNLLHANEFINNSAISLPSVASFLAPNMTAGGATYGAFMTVGVAESNYNCGAVQFSYFGAGDSRNYINLGIYGFGAPLVVTSTKVGIGMTAPLYPLHVTGNCDGGALGPVTISANASGTIGTALTLDATAVTGGAKYSFISTGPVAAAGAGKFAIYNGSVFRYVFTVSDTGGYCCGTNATELGQLTVYPYSASTKGIVIAAAAAQTANLLEWRVASGVIAGSVNASGNLGVGFNAPTSTIHAFGDLAVSFPNATYNIRGIFAHGGDYSGINGEGGFQIACQGTAESANGSGNIKFFVPTGASAGNLIDATYKLGMSIMQSGTVRIGTSSTVVSSNNQLEVESATTGGGLLVKGTVDTAVTINATNTANGTYLLMQTNGTNVFSFQVGGSTMSLIAKQVMMKNLISGGGINVLTNADTTNRVRFGTNGTFKVAGLSDYVTDGLAWIDIGAGTTTIAPIRLAAGTNKTTAAAGEMEYNGTNLFFTRAGTTREGVLTESAVTTEVLISDTSVTVNIGGVTYKLLAKA